MATQRYHQQHSPKTELAIRPADPKPVRSHAKHNLFLAEKFSQWLEINNHSPHTRTSYARLIADFCQHIGPRSLAEIKHPDIRQYFLFLQEERGIGSRSLDQKLYALALCITCVL
jgi:hypothetical protein